MSFASRVYENRRSIVSVGLVTLFAAGLLGFALLYDGESTAEVDLNDSGVWVTRTTKGELGRFNYEAKATDGVLQASSTGFDVEQDAQRILLNSASTSSASPVNAAQLALDSTMELPAGAQVSSGGPTTAVYDPETGRAWVMPFDSAAFDEKKLKPTVKAGKGGRLTVGNDGTAFLAVPSDGKIYTIPTSAQGVADDVQESSLPVATDAEVQVSAVGDKPVVLDQATGNLVLPDGDTVEVADGSQGMLQQPSGEADNVVLATPKSLVLQPLGGGDETTQVVDGGASGTASAPVQLNGCVYGAWAGSGQVIRNCEDEDNDFGQVLEGLIPSASLVYRVNRDVIVLNDMTNGQLWMASDEFELVDDWDTTEPKAGKGEKTESEQTTPLMVDNFVADRSKPNTKPEPKDDTFGVRPGRTTVLNVLGNDTDKDGDVLTATVKTEPQSDITIDRVLDGVALQADVPDDATGRITFKYEVDDGREGGKAEASVTLNVVPPAENHPPTQPDGVPVLRVAQDEQASIKVLPYFKDPDGDDLFLSNATTADPMDEVRFRPDGTVEFLDGGSGTGLKMVDLQVSDSSGTPVEGKLRVDVVSTNVKPVAVQDHVTVLTGEPVTVSPLKNDYDANGDELSLNRVDEPLGTTVTKNTAARTFKFESDQAGSYDVTYQITDGPEATMGLVRVDVVDPPTEAGAPVAVSDQVLLPTGGTALVDVLANDTDPAGGVLVVQGVSVPANAPISVSVLNHQILKVSEIKRLGEPVIVNYKVANGSGTVTGQVRVVPIPTPAQMRPPEAGNDEAVVHVGDVVTIPVLKNDTHPDGVAMRVTDELQEEPSASAGEAFVSEDTVRFRAGDDAGVYDAVYEVEDANGQKDSARVTITVKDDPENTAPQLPDIEARVLSEGIVRIPLPLDGSDPDGDYVTLSSISGAPAKGNATIVDGFIDYKAANATGLDTFTYQVADTRGAVGEGLVRVGIVAPPATNQEPQALDDETTVRPGRTVAITALDNDSDPDGDQIGLVAKGFEGTEGLKPKAVEDDVVVTAPGDEGPYSFYYGIQDSYQASASGAITVNVDQNAPLLRPIAHDDVVTVDDVEGSTSVTVQVLDNDVDPDGVGADLEVSVDPGLEGVAVTESNAIEVQLTENAQVITYTVTDMDGLEAKAFVRVPGDQLRPHIKPGLDPLKAFSGEPLTIDLADYVVVREGRVPRITEDNTVKALEGKVEITDNDTLVYTSAEDYAGAASVSFEVTDGTGPDDEEGLTAVLTLPIDVTPSENQPPKITGTPVLKVAAAEEAAVDLSRYVKDPDKDPLTFEVEGRDGFEMLVSGATVTGEVNASVPKGTIVQLPMTVSDGRHSVQAELTVEVTPSTRPPAKTTDDVVLDAHQGKATTVPVLANDSNPFPETPLKVVAAASEAGGGDVTFTDSDVVVTPEPDFTGVMTVRYTVQDATGDPARQVDGFAKLTVLGKPDAPRAPRVEEVRSETVVLSWDQPNNNGADITSYMLRTNTGQEHKCDTTTCTFDGLKNNVKYTFTVTATNEVDESAPSPSSREVRPDERPDKPEPPSLKFGDKKLTVSWQNKSYTDRSPIDCVTLEISPPPTDGATQKVCEDNSPVVWEGLDNGTAYTVRVQAKNAAEEPSEWSDPSAPEIPAAKPAQPEPPTASRVNNKVGGQINVGWTAPANNGDAIRMYYLDVYENGSKTKTLTRSGTSTVVEALNPESSYTFTVQAENKAGKSLVSAQSAAEPAYGEPDSPSGVRASNPGDGRATVSWSAISSTGFRGPAHRYEVSANGGAAENAGDTTSYNDTGLTNGTSYTFRVRACNQYICGAWSAASNAVKPYGPPIQPTMTATDGIEKVTFTWDGDGYNGLKTTVQVSGAVRSTNKTGTVTVAGSPGQTMEACVTVEDEMGKTAQDCDSGTVLTPRAWVTEGAVRSGCAETCRYWELNWSGFDAGNHQAACWAGDTSAEGGPSGWHDIHEGHATTWAGATKYPMDGSQGSRQLSCYMGANYNGTEVAFYVDGKRYEVSRWNS
ncbi:fibronectin type III domain protein [Promicromonospora sp. AC04]|uniref:Ig-like domain-containing protein n=1 Tax=Promicromonospora sp. AC04 TaxID=2135723 RepID=UPI000D473AD7|nr:Ig-like domain-containing protein [Promicromonospora sp. AC04]PUB25947.1 fibronectin type III domain protein [Promicromonospora sp. AC04]